jgi:dsDNA-specific endonuclease/ATPase MutS2
MEPKNILIEETIDLHSFLPREVAGLVDEYLHQSVLKGYREVRIIHGRGIGVQRRIVHEILKQHPSVIQYKDSSDLGSTIVILKQESQ